MGLVQTNDVRTYFEDRGSGTPLVFIHGAIVDHNQWTPQVEALSDDFRTIVYDVRGHGRTGGSATNAYSITLFADDLDALITALGLEKPILCGHSSGGCIAQVYAARYPDKISGLILADTFMPELFTRGEWFQRSAMLKATIPPVRLIGYERVEKAMVWFQERLSAGASGNYENIEQLRKEGPKMETDEFAKVIRAVASFHETPVDFSAVTVPTLVLYGEHEPPFLRRHAPKLGAEIANAVVREVPGAGHASNLDNPDFFTKAMQAFFAQEGFHAGAAELQDSADSG